jgi:hypothetical protein
LSVLVEFFLELTRVVSPGAVPSSRSTSPAVSWFFPLHSCCLFGEISTHRVIRALCWVLVVTRLNFLVCEWYHARLRVEGLLLSRRVLCPASGHQYSCLRRPLEVFLLPRLQTDASILFRPG